MEPDDADATRDMPIAARVALLGRLTLLPKTKNINFAPKSS
jgi:hypothetical protein